ncbi:MAG: DNA-3-methyladenine glycosylase [Chloroflexi bacterium]|nr:DNA-3-methyladenine glycosylase [Chloroflexota bacterium]
MNTQPARLQRQFYLHPASQCVCDFLGKKLVFSSPQGRVAGIISDVEAYPAFVDEVHHGNKRTPRTEVMYGLGGFAYVYLIYGTWHQFAAVVNQEDIPDVVFIRGVIPTEGIPIMRENFGQELPDAAALTNSPGKLCKSFGITRGMYGEDLTANTLWLEDVGIKIDPALVRRTKRVGINSRYQGSDAEFRFWAPSTGILP